MPGCSMGYCHGWKAKAKRRHQFEAKARARGIIEGSSGWYRYLRAHGC